MSESPALPAPAPWPGKVAAAGFLALLAIVPVTQFVWERGAGRMRTTEEFVRAFASGHPSRIEESLSKHSFLHDLVTPWYQWTVSELLGHGNEKALEGRDGWLYYADDVETATGPGILTAACDGEGALDAIVDFRDQLAERGIELLLVPIPAKGTIDASRLARPAPRDVPCNSDLAEFTARLQTAHVTTVDLWSWMRERAANGPQFLPRDTHWNPETMQAAAELVAGRVEEVLGPPEFELVPASRTGRALAEGDLVAMLRLPRSCSRFPPMPLEIQQVLRLDETPWRPNPRAEVLVLGDSFTGVYSDPRLGLGESAGFAEQLSRASRRPLDVIAVVNGAATTVRQTAVHRAALDGKRLVVWEFSVRTLATAPGTWRRVSLDRGADAEASGSLSVRAQITAVSRVPSDYAYPSCLVVFAYRVLEVRAGDAAVGDTIWVTQLAWDEYRPTPVAQFDVGDVQDLDLEPVPTDAEEPWDETDRTGPLWRIRR